MSRVLVSGGTGFLGGAIVDALLARGVEVAVLSRNPGRAAGRFPAGRVEGRAGDVTRPDTLAGAFDDIDTVVQCVQFSGFPVEAPAKGRTFMEVDGRGTETVIRAARAEGVRKMVYLSGVGADPESPKPWYRAKGLAEAALRESGLAWSVVRPSWVYGPRDVSLNRFITAIRAIPFVFPQIGPGTQRVSPIHVDDLAEIAAAAITEDLADGQIVEAGGPEPMTLDEIVRTAMRALGKEKPILHVPLGLVKLGAWFLELAPGQVLSRDAVDFIIQDGVADSTTRTRCLPGLAPRDLATGLASYLG